MHETKNNERSDRTRKSGQSPKEGKKAKTKKKATPAYLIIGVLAAALIGVLTYFLWPVEDLPPPEPMAVSGGRGIVAVPENIEELLERLSEPPPGGHYITTMNNRWTFERWDIPSENAYVENDIRNTHMVYFDLVLDEDERLVYSSPYIPQGATLSNFALDESVPAGEHSAVVTYNLVEDDGSEVSQVSVRVTLDITR